MKQTLIKIMAGATTALIIPLLGNNFIEGWNWSWHDFVFAWVFWVVMAISIFLVARKFTKYKVIVGVIVSLFFAAIWVVLATG